MLNSIYINFMMFFFLWLLASQPLENKTMILIMFHPIKVII